MEYKVEIYIQHQDDESVVHPLVDFFRPVASATVRKEEKLHYKEWHEAIQVVLNVVGVWAAKRYIGVKLATLSYHARQRLIPTIFTPFCADFHHIRL